MRVFFAHPKSMEDDAIDSWTARLHVLVSESGYANVEVITGRDDFKQYAPSAGGFSGWVRDVATRKEAMSQKPYYDFFVSPYREIGKATADILTLALHHKQPVIYAEEREDSTIELHRVRQVVVEDPDNYTNGWWLDT